MALVVGSRSFERDYNGGLAGKSTQWAVYAVKQDEERLTMWSSNNKSYLAEARGDDRRRGCTLFAAGV
ncbi:MAG: hypothetical protein QM771_06695 [Nitrospira sp.]